MFIKVKILLFLLMIYFTVSTCELLGGVQLVSYYYSIWCVHVVVTVLYWLKVAENEPEVVKS
jgi:hypothetical protein